MYISAKCLGRDENWRADIKSLVRINWLTALSWEGLSLQGYQEGREALLACSSRGDVSPWEGREGGPGECRRRREVCVDQGSGEAGSRGLLI